MKDMEGLAKSEQALKELQEKLTLEESEKKKHIKHKEQLEARVRYYKRKPVKYLNFTVFLALYER